MKKIAWLGLVVLLAGGAFATTYSKNMDNKEAPKVGVAAEAVAAPDAAQKSAKSEKEKPLVKLTAPTIAPITYGASDAPIVIEEFASLTCSHCADFHEKILPELDKMYLAKGNVQMHWNSFIRNEQDLRGTQLIFCAEGNEKRQQFIKALLQAQGQWAFSMDFLNNLRVMAQVGGISNEQFDKCMADKPLEDKLLANRDYAIGLGLDSTPYFVIDKQTIKGARDIGMFKAAIEDAIKPKK